MRRFVTGCYKKILGINNDVEITEKDLSVIFGVDTIDVIWRKKENEFI